MLQNRPHTGSSRHFCISTPHGHQCLVLRRIPKCFCELFIYNYTATQTAVERATAGGRQRSMKTVQEENWTWDSGKKNQARHHVLPIPEFSLKHDLYLNFGKGRLGEENKKNKRKKMGKPIIVHIIFFTLPKKCSS